jgi:hypothetical protein
VRAEEIQSDPVPRRPHREAWNSFNSEQVADLEIAVKMGAVSVRVLLWADRWVWVDARQYGTRRKGGWVWSKTLEGRFVASGGAGVLVATLEASMSLYAAQPATEIARIWERHLAVGPQRL